MLTARWDGSGVQRGFTVISRMPRMALETGQPLLGLLGRVLVDHIAAHGPRVAVAGRHGIVAAPASINTTPRSRGRHEG